MTTAVERWYAVQQFVFLEAKRLDERDWDKWLAMFLPTAKYWVPYEWGQERATDHVSLFYEDLTMLRMRIDRLKNGLSPLEWPPSRTNHHLSNVGIENVSGNQFTVTAYMLFAEYRREEQRLFSCRVTWDLQASNPKSDADIFKIAAKRVDLLNCDQESGHLRIAVPL